ncbi:oligosaccharide flippase family protein [Desulfovibrio litoralis]|uniref:oligosaccharide flippase family protein n=1 Tax=Desulfovibrio litoralis TaxID=466107 RepID=UPI000933DDAC|nr:oligosaccharide flippase family protein [Desulfovibrio litoralis]
MKESSLAKRYVFKLIANFAAIPIYLVMEALLPRALGPASYGNFNFITAQFLQATTFLDMGSSTCLSISMSKRLFRSFGRIKTLNTHQKQPIIKKINLLNRSACSHFGLILTYPSK